MADKNDIKNQQDLNKAQQDGLRTITDQRDILREITGELRNQQSNAAQAGREYAKLESIAQSLQERNGKVAALTAKEITKAERRAKLALDNAKYLADNLQNKIKLQKLDEAAIKDAIKAGDITEKEAALLRAKLGNFEHEENFVKTINDELKQRKEYETFITDKVGLTGSLLKGASGLLTKMGMDGGIVSNAISEAKEEMEALADESYQTGKNISRMKILSAGLGKLWGGLKGQLLSIEVVGASIAKAFTGLDKSSTKLVRLTGQNNAIAASFNSRLATGVDVLEQMVEFTERTGLAASAVFSSGDLARMAEAKNMLGLSAKEANNLGMYSKVAGTSIDSYKEGIVESVNNYNAANSSAVAHGVVLKDVLNVSDGIGMSLGGNPGKIAAAASAARKLGLDLQKVDAIASSLMNFETSIENELEAQLMTGKNINLAKARELALNNDLEGLAGEISKQIGSAAEFANMNRLEQESLAKALGMNRDELAKTLIAQEAQGNLTKEQKARMRGVTVEQLEQMEATESLQKAFAKLAEPIASILTTLTPIVNVLAKIIAFVAPVAGPLWAASAAVKAMGGSLSGVAKNFGGLVTSSKEFLKNISSGGVKKFFTGLSDSFKAGKAGSPLDAFSAAKAKGLSDKQILSGFGGKEAKDAMMLPADKAKGAADAMKTTSEGAQSANGIQKGLGERIKEFFTGLAAGLKKMGKKDVFIGALGALAAAPGMLAMGIAAPGLMLLSMVPGKGVQQALTGLGKGLSALGKAAMDPMLWLGVAALAGIGASMIPLTYALSLLAPLLESVGTIITSIFGGVATVITAVADGFVNLMGALSMDKILPLLTLGPALIGIAAGLSMLGPAGILALPGIAALGALVAMATPLAALGSLFGGGEGGSDSNSGVEEKLDAILAAIQAGGNVYIDGNQVGQALVLGSYKSS